MPGASVRIDLGICRIGERAVRQPTRLSRGSLVDRRAHQRMSEPHSDAELDQPSRSRRSRGSGINPEQLGRTPHRHRVTDRLGRGDEQQQPRRLRKRHQPALEGLLDAPRQRPRARQPESRRPAERE